MQSAAQLAESIRRDGYAIATGLISRAEVDAIKASLAPWLRGELMGRNDFEGFRSERVYALLAKAPPVARIVEHPLVLGVLDQLLKPHYRLSACLAIQVHPGETPQGWQAVESFVLNPRPRAVVGLDCI